MPGLDDARSLTSHLGEFLQKELPGKERQGRSTMISSREEKRIK